MNRTHKPLLAALSAVLGATLLAGLGASYAFADTATVGLDASLNTNVNVSSQDKQDNATVTTGVRASVKAHSQTDSKNRADQEINRRVSALDSLNVRIGDIIKLSADEKSSLGSLIQAQISALSALEAKIQTDTSTTSLKADIQSIINSYRIFILVLPKGAILAATGRIDTIVSDMQTIGTKLQARISAAASAGANVSVAQSALADYNTKVTDASVQANAAQSEVANLQPDNGNASVQASNTAALKDARSKIQVAQQDFVAARKDITTIRQNLPKVNASATTTESTSANTH